MREASFLLPLDTAGVESIAAHAWVKQSLLATFQGYTATHKVGQWRDPETGNIYDDKSVEYVVAYDTGDWLPAMAHFEQVRLIALTAGRQSGQLAVYLKDHDGNVEIVAT